MAKFGKFVGLNRKVFDSNELSLFRETIDNVFGDIGLTSLVKSDDDGFAFFNVELNNGNQKITNIAKRGDFAYNVSNFKFMVVKSEGRIEVGLRSYVGEPFIQYSIKCWTDGKYHEYRRQYRNDYNFEGKDHYFYDTEITDFQTELNTWKRNIFNGIDY
jgi:hypothetical protein